METDSLKTIAFSEKFLKFWGNRENAAGRIAESAILEAFREKRIDMEKAMDILEMTEDEFYELYKRRKIFVTPGDILDENDWVDAPEIVELLLERRKIVQEEIQEGDFVMLDDLQEKLGE